LRLSNLSAAIIRPQLDEVPRRVLDGRTGHDRVAAQLETSPWLTVPAKLPPEERAPDSIQFNLVDMSDTEAAAFSAAVARLGVKVQVFGASADNARAFWNWQFIPGPVPELPRTRAMLSRACDTRLPARLSDDELDMIAAALLAAADEVMGRVPAYGT
jgi:dTDP-4-amino-4,6-dideoxygalactose transaminase